jgi:predicted SprT family Zn-dependent metalloprotease
MDLNSCRNLTLILMAENGLDTPSGWKFEFDGGKLRFGSCSYQNKLITLSRHLVSLNTWDEVRKTVIHEIAHALTPGDHHGHAWQSCMIRLGAVPSRCYNEAGNGRQVSLVKAPFVGYCPTQTCPQHNATWPRFRKRKVFCGLCKAPINYRYHDA